MHLALVPRARLAALDGAAAPSTLAALDDALAARAAAGFPTLTYDPEAGLPTLGVGPASLGAPALVAQLRSAAAALAARGERLESLWIVGGPRVVPFASLPNPMRDRDGPLHGDGPYALVAPAEPLAQWPVGRSPDVAERPGLLADQLRRVAAAHRAGPRPAGPILALAAARWAAVTEQLLAGISATLSLAPPLAAGAGASAVSGARVVYCNLHGVRGGDAWYGQPPGDSGLVPALRPADLSGLRLDDALVVTQACFGARLAPAGDETTVATALLAAGARGFYGALGLTYGAPDPPPGESDLLARALLQALQAPGARLGPALIAAQLATLRELLRQRGALDAVGLKTLLSFQLYGDPLAPA